MRSLLGLIAAGGLVLGASSAAKAQVTFSFGNSGRPQVTLGQPYGYPGAGNYGYQGGAYGAPAPAYGYQGGAYGAPAPAYGYQGAPTYVQPGYSYPGTSYYGSGYRGYSYPGTTTYYSSRSYSVTPAPYYQAPGYAPYSGYTYQQRGVTIPTPVGGILLGR